MESKIQSAKRRLTQGFQAVFQPSKLYIYPRFEYSYHCLSFSQEGEDKVLWKLLGGKNLKEKGFYVDIGAHHPQKFSNTYFFYLRGWKGINIDPIPDGITKFNKLRNRDTNLEIAIFENTDKLTYYIYNQQALNTFSKNLVEQRKKESINPIRQKEIKTHTLAEVLDKYLPKDQEIDFINIDVEGLDYAVLKSNDWQKYRPSLIVIETLATDSLLKALNSSVCLFLQKQGYGLISKTHNSLFFKEGIG